MNFQTVKFQSRNASEHSNGGVFGPTLFLLRSELERDPGWEPRVEDIPMYLPSVWRVEQGTSSDEPEVLYEGSSEEVARAVYRREVESFRGKQMGRPSQGRSYRLQATITPEQVAWLEEQKSQHGDKSVSDVVHRLIDEAMSSEGNLHISQNSSQIP